MFSLKKQIQKWRPQLLVLSFMAVTAACFQNCSDDVKFSQAVDENGNSILALSPDGLLTINGGAFYTNSIGVLLDIKAEHAVEMNIANEGCVPGVSNLDVFEPLSATRNWVLADSDGNSLVYLKLKSTNNKYSGCIAANIVLDRKNPTITFENAPDKIKIVKTASADVKALDEVSGIDKMYCKIPGQTNFSECNSHVDVMDAQEGTNLISYYATDKAGNRSETIETSWLVDTIAPTVQIIDPKPAALLTINSALVYFNGQDSGSGVAGYKCSIDNAVAASCSSPVVLNGLADGNHNVKVYAFDNAGHVSDPASISFQVDTQPSGAFQILGVSGNGDTKVDNYFENTSNPKITWSASAGSQGYKATILNEAKNVTVCALANFVAGVTSGTFSNCQLLDNNKYVVRMSSIRNGLETMAADFLFTVDASAPKINITSVVVDNSTKKATIQFAVTDAGSGVASAKCYKTLGTDVREDNCLGLTTIVYDNLLPGDHSFYIKAADNLDHQSQSVTKTFALQAIVCDPFDQYPDPEYCPKGLRANLFYASAADRSNMTNDQLGQKFNTVQKLIDLGIKSNALLYMAYLDVPFRDFTQGFTTTENGNVTDDSGKKLDEWFAMELTGVMKLAAGQAAGYYQLLVVSDDGSNVFTGVLGSNGSITYTNVVANDGVHATRVGCQAKNKEIYLDANSRIPIKIQYYQGPRTEIAMSLYMRKVPAANSSLSAYCGNETSDRNYWYGTSSTTGRYQLIKNEGFLPLKTENFVDGVN